MTATQPNLYELWRSLLFSFGGYGLALAALAHVVFGAIECLPIIAPTSCGSDFSDIPLSPTDDGFLINEIRL